MNVRIQILFKPLTEADWNAMRSLANRLTNDRQSVRVSAGTNPGWLIAEFTMPTEAQYKAEPKVYAAIRLYAGNRHDVTYGFPYTEAQRARADRQAAQRKARRQARKKREE